MIRDITPIAAIDWDSPGKRLYHIPFTLDGSWGRVRVPLCVICGPRPGKTVVAIGGTHGDEYEGPVGLKNLIRETSAEAVTAGRLIVLPVLNVPAFQAAQRHSPLDGANMNRVFPGDAHGTITQRIARFRHRRNPPTRRRGDRHSRGGADLRDRALLVVPPH